MADECQEGDPPPPGWFGPIVRCVVTTASLARSVAAYQEGLGWRVRRRRRVPAVVARAWGAPGVAGGLSARVGPDSRIGGEVELVQPPGAVPEPPAPLRTLGWAALEVCVANVDVAVARLTADFTILNRPAALSGPAAALRAAQVAGPDGEVIYLTEIRRPLPPFQLPRPSPGPAADGIFVVVLAARDLAATRAWWEGRFPVRRCTDRLATIAALNRAFDRPADARNRISSLQLSGRAVLEIDQYPDAAEPRRVPVGGLPGGIALVAVAVPDPGNGSANGRREVIAGPDGVRVELVPAPRPIDVV